MNDVRTMLLKILDLIDYSEDKEKFSAEFLRNVNLQALLDLFNTLPQDKKDQIQQQITSIGNNPLAIQETLRAHFADSQLQEAIKNSTKNAVTEYMKAINPTLSETQRTNIMNMAHELNQNNPPAQAAS